MADREPRRTAGSSFRHRALIYVGKQGFLDGSLPFIRAGIQAQEPTLVMVDRDNESLMNVAFSGARRFQMLCPCETGPLAPEVIEEAARSHPYVFKDSQEMESDTYPGLDATAAPFDDPLPDPPADAPRLRFSTLTLFELREFIRDRASASGFGDVVLEDFVTAVNEVATNSVLYGGGRGTAKLWHEDDVLICQIEDRGQFREPLVGRSHPPASEPEGRGLWLANELCDLIQIRSFPEGTVTRVHARRRD